jgi:hypothetical protein
MPDAKPGAKPGARAVVVVVPVDDAAAADAAGARVDAIEAAGLRAAVFLGDPALEEDRAALLELVDELFVRE